MGKMIAPNARTVTISLAVMSWEVNHDSARSTLARAVQERQLLPLALAALYAKPITLKTVQAAKKDTSFLPQQMKIYKRASRTCATRKIFRRMMRTMSLDAEKA
jgi:hypothetical protein